MFRSFAKSFGEGAFLPSHLRSPATWRRQSLPRRLTAIAVAKSNLGADPPLGKKRRLIWVEQEAGEGRPPPDMERAECGDRHDAHSQMAPRGGQEQKKFFRSVSSESPFSAGLGFAFRPYRGLSSAANAATAASQSACDGAP